MREIFKAVVCVLFLVPFIASAQNENINFTDNQGKKQGSWVKLDEGGKKLYIGSFIDGVPVGKFTYYHDSGTPWSITNFSENGTVAHTQMFAAGGKISGEGKYINEKKDSLWRFYGNNGKTISTENYVAGVKDGAFIVYYSNGELAEKKIWKNGVLEGDCKKYFETGQLKQYLIYKNNKVEGKALFYHPSGQLAIEGIYKNDFKNGPWKYFDTNGKLTRSDNYLNGRYIGDKNPDVIPKEQVEKEKRESEKFELKDPYQDQ